MRNVVLALIATLATSFILPAPSFAQGAGTETVARSRTRSSATKPKREPTVGQLAARERQKKCGVEWRDAKSKGTTSGLKWPQYWSKCNARLKGGTA